ncbi:MAG: DUF1559 domain-containing protein, partial [Gemmataceae bacterium]
GNSTGYLIHGWATLTLPYQEQDNIFRQFDTSSDPKAIYAGAAGPGNTWVCGTGAILHPKARGRTYTDVPSGTRSPGKNIVKTFICPSTPLDSGSRDPFHGYGAMDYMAIAVSDIEEDPADANFKARCSTARRPVMVKSGAMSCEGRTITGISDGTSNTILIIEDAGRAHPNVANFGAFSTRNAPHTDPEPVGANLRRVHAWADPDASTNGISGPPGGNDFKRKVLNNNASPVGGPPGVPPAGCAWSNNNCGPNDEPFSFHSGIVQAAMADGSVRALRDTLDPLVVKAAATASGGEVFTLD